MRTDCPMCLKEDWFINPHYFSPILINNENKPDLSYISPQVHIICNNCGYVAHFSAIHLGLVEK